MALMNPSTLLYVVQHPDGHMSHPDIEKSDATTAVIRFPKAGIYWIGVYEEASNVLIAEIGPKNMPDDCTLSVVVEEWDRRFPLRYPFG